MSALTRSVLEHALKAEKPPSTGACTNEKGGGLGASETMVLRLVLMGEN